MGFCLKKEQTASTPYIYINEDQSYMKFEGESFHENVVEFYRDVAQWLERYLDTPFHKLTFDCKLTYFNSSTAKLLLNMLMELDEHSSQENCIVVNWIASDDNSLIVECGEDFAEEMENLQFNIVVN